MAMFAITRNYICKLLQLHICPNTVLRELKKEVAALEPANTSLPRTLNPAEVAWDLERAGEA